MSGGTGGGRVAWALLSSSAAVADIVVDRIEPLRLSEGVAVPAVSFRSISRRVRETVSNAETVIRTVERIEVTGHVSADNYPQLGRLMAAIYAAMAHKRHEALAGVTQVSVVEPNEGPELRDDTTNVITRSIDFMVHFNEVRPTA